MFVRKATVAELGQVKTSLENALSAIGTLESDDVYHQEWVRTVLGDLQELVEALDAQMNPQEAVPPMLPPPED